MEEEKKLETEVVEKKKKKKIDAKTLIKEMTFDALLAAFYVVFTVVISPISYGAIQFRFSEILVLFCFFNKRYSIGLTLGCLIANIFSPTAALDIPFGTAATLLACIGIMFSKWMALAIMFPVITNAFIVGGELYLYGSPFWFNVGWIALGELVVMIVGYILFFILKRYKSFFKAINATQNTEYKF